MAGVRSTTCFAPDGRAVYTASGHTVHALATATGSVTRSFLGHTAAVSALCIHPTNPRQLLSSSLDGTIRAWDVDDAICLQTFHIGLPVVALTSAPLPSGCSPRVFAVVVVQNSTGGGTHCSDGSDSAATVAVAEVAVQTPNGKKRQSSSQEASLPASQRSSKRSRGKAGEDHVVDEDANDAAPAPAAAAPGQGTTQAVGSSGSKAGQGPARHALWSPWHVPTVAESAEQVALAVSAYPLGDEPATLQVRPPSYSVHATVNASGRRRELPLSRLLDIDLAPVSGSAPGMPVRPVSLVPVVQRVGYVTGVSVRCYGSVPLQGAADALLQVPDLAVAFTCREKLYVYRCAGLQAPYLSVHSSSSSSSSSSAGNGSAGAHKAGGSKLQANLLCTVALHPSQPYVTVGDLKGKLLTWYLPELAPTFTVPASYPSASTGGGLKGKGAGKGLDMDGLLVPVGESEGSPAVLTGSSTAHWHSHTIWAADIAPDGSYLLTGGEEATLVIWQLPSSAASAATGSASGLLGPQKGKKSMTFVPRLGAPVRRVSAWAQSSVAHGASASAAAALSASTAGAAHVRGLPGLMYVVTLVDNSLVLLNGLSLSAMWRSNGSVQAVAGLPCQLPAGVLAYYAHAQEKARQKKMRVAMEEGNKALVNQLKHAPSALFPSLPLPSSTRACSRHLRAGMVYDPRTKGVILNGFPGKGTLQVQAYPGGSSSASGAEIEVCPRNLVSRVADEPSPAPRITHACTSSDGLSMATMEVLPAAAGGESCVLKFWHWSTAASGGAAWVLDTRVDSPHKTDVTVLLYSGTGGPSSEHLVISASADRTFKTWSREVRNVAVTASASGAGAAGAGAAASAATVQKTVFVWSCLSVGFHRDAPITAGSLSADASVLALAFGPALTLWSPRTNTLRRVLVAPPAPPKASAAASGDSNGAHADGSAGLLSVSVAAAGNDEEDAMDVSGPAALHGSAVSNPMHLSAVLPGLSSPQHAHATTAGKKGKAGSNAAEVPASPTPAAAVATTATPSSLAHVRAHAKLESITHVAFLGLTPYLAVATTSTLTVWDLLSCTPLWSYRVGGGARALVGITALVADRVGLATSDRFAVVVQRAVPESSGAAVGSSVHTHSLLLFSSAHPVPLAVWPLSQPAHAAGLLLDFHVGSAGAGAGRQGTLAELQGLHSARVCTRPPVFAVCFVPTASSSASSPQLGPGQYPAHDLAVLSPWNELSVLHAPPHAVPAVPAAGAAVGGVHADDAVRVEQLVTPEPAASSTTTTAAAAAASPGTGATSAMPLLVQPLPSSAGMGAQGVAAAVLSTSILGGASAATSAQGEAGGVASAADHKAVLALVERLGSTAAVGGNASGVASALLAALMPSLPSSMLAQVRASSAAQGSSTLPTVSTSDARAGASWAASSSAAQQQLAEDEDMRGSGGEEESEGDAQLQQVVPEWMRLLAAAKGTGQEEAAMNSTSKGGPPSARSAGAASAQAAGLGSARSSARLSWVHASGAGAGAGDGPAAAAHSSAQRSGAKSVLNASRSGGAEAGSGVSVSVDAPSGLKAFLAEGLAWGMRLFGQQ